MNQAKEVVMDFTAFDSGTITITKRGPQYPAGVLVKFENVKVSDAVSDLNALWNEIRPLLLADPIVASLTDGFVTPTPGPDEDVMLAISKKLLSATLKFKPTDATLAATPVTAKPPSFGAAVPPVTPRGIRFVPSTTAPAPFLPTPDPVVVPAVPRGELVTPPPAQGQV